MPSLQYTPNSTYRWLGMTILLIVMLLLPTVTMAQEATKNNFVVILDAGHGGNDAGAIYISGEGVKTASLSVPCRYLHSPAGIVSEKDVDAMKALVELFIDRVEEVL